MNCDPDFVFERLKSNFPHTVEYDSLQEEEGGYQQPLKRETLTLDETTKLVLTTAGYDEDKFLSIERSLPGSATVKYFGNKTELEDENFTVDVVLVDGWNIEFWFYTDHLYLPRNLQNFSNMKMKLDTVVGDMVIYEAEYEYANWMPLNLFNYTNDPCLIDFFEENPLVKTKVLPHENVMFVDLSLEMI